jgi:hypothetical protein
VGAYSEGREPARGLKRGATMIIIDRQCVSDSQCREQHTAL